MALTRRGLLAASLATGLVSRAQAQAQAQAQASSAPRPFASPRTIRIGLGGKVEMNAAIPVADAFGEFAKENLKPEYFTQKPSDGLVLLSTERIDVLASQPSAAFFNAIAGGNDLRMVGPVAFPSPDNRTGFWVARSLLNGKPFSPEMLKGQTVASLTGVGTGVSYWLEKRLETVGLDLRVVSWRSMGIPDVLIALENGAVNVGFLFDGIWQHADPAKLEFAVGGIPEMSVGGLFYGPTLLRQHRDVGEAFMRVMTRTVQTYLQGDYHNDPKVSQVLASYLGISLAELRQGGGLVFPPNQPIVGYTASELQRTYALTPNVLSYSTPLPDDQVIDRSFLRAAGV